MRLIWKHETPIYYAVPPLGVVHQGDIVDILDKDVIASLKNQGFEKAPAFKGNNKEEN
jgi:hypothetical protein